MLTYLRPRTVDEAAGYLSEYDDIKILAGGTDIMTGAESAGHPAYLMDIKHIPQLKSIEAAQDALKIGAAVSVNQLMESGYAEGPLSIIYDAGLVFANYPLRNRATLLGNLCSAQPAGDMIPVSLVLGGYIEAVSAEGSRQIPLEDFYPAMRTSALRKDELAVYAVFPKREGKGVFLKKKRTRGHDLAQVSVAAFRGRDGAYDLALGAVSATAVLIKDIVPAGVKPDVQSITDRALSAISPISDVRSTKEYRIEIAAHFIRQAVETLENLPGKEAV